MRVVIQRIVLIWGAYFPAFCGFDSDGFSDLLHGCWEQK